MSQSSHRTSRASRVGISSRPYQFKTSPGTGYQQRLRPAMEAGRAVLSFDCCTRTTAVLQFSAGFVCDAVGSHAGIIDLSISLLIVELTLVLYTTSSIHVTSADLQLSNSIIRSGTLVHWYTINTNAVYPTFLHLNHSCMLNSCTPT